MKTKLIPLMLAVAASIGTISATEGALSGLFSVSADKQVYFSQGNLQYQASTNTWRFAENQYDTIGALNANISTTYDGWIDLFGWGTGNNPTNASIDNNDYSSFVDWGSNAISNGGSEANLWRTLTKDEWYYLLKTRPDASNKIGLAEVAGVQGNIILPDIYDGTPINTGRSIADINIINASDWAAFEAYGAVFLPIAGYRIGTNVEYVNQYTGYWATTPYDTYQACNVNFIAQSYNPQSYADRYVAQSVRLIIDKSSCTLASGTCGADGDNLTWELACDNVLTISGYGNMTNPDNGQAPWYEYRHNISAINLPDGLTDIGYFAFYDCRKLTSVTIPNSVTKIGAAAFANCYNLQNINLPNTIVSVGVHAFQDCYKLSTPILNEHIFAYMPAGLQISEYTIPEGIESVAGYAFDDQNALTSLTMPASVAEIGVGMGASVTSLYNYAETPQIISEFVFSNNTKLTCTLYVPANSISLYKAACQWKDFTNILPIPGTEPEKTDIMVIYNDKDAVEVEKEQISLHLPDAPVVPGFTFVGWDVIAGHLDVGIIIQALYTYNGDPTSAPSEVVNPTNKTQKLIREGNVFILRDGKTYTVQGQEVK